jgi:hypothetical protein
MINRVRDFYFVLPGDDYRLLKECLTRYSLGYNGLDLDIPAGDGQRAFTCSENELKDVIQQVEHNYPLARALANLIRQQLQPISKPQNDKPKKSKTR